MERRGGWKAVQNGGAGGRAKFEGRMALGESTGGSSAFFQRIGLLSGGADIYV